MVQELRPSLKYLKENYPIKKDLIGVEIGNYKGANAESILYHLPIKKLYLVDPYKEYDVYKNAKGNNLKQGWLTQLRLTTREFLSETYREKVKFIYKMSEDAVNLIPNDLDFVYIDGNHLYEYCKKDIELYYPKLKSGGILAGHDYHDECSPGVTIAADEFAKVNGFTLYNGINDFWIVK